MVSASEQEISPKVHVIKRGNGWALRRQDASKAIKVYETKAAAIQGGQKLLTSGYDLIIHKEDGSVEQWKKAKTASA